MAHPYFHNRKLAIATQHGKEAVMTPLLVNKLGVDIVLLPNLDTDAFGTFTGEVERSVGPIETLRKKCELAFKASGCELILANEGSFGMHPTTFFTHADDELVMLWDKKNNLEVVARELTTETNFNGSEIESEKQLEEFAKKVLFPSHAIILRNGQDHNERIVKGIQDRAQLLASYHEILTEYGKVYAETDMRAMHNPTRMRAIALATSKLVDKLFNLCPECQTPGFDVSKILEGLPCSLCKQPTRSILSHISICSRCQFTEEKRYPKNIQYEDPMFCDYCNP